MTSQLPVAKNTENGSAVTSFSYFMTTLVSCKFQRGLVAMEGQQNNSPGSRTSEFLLHENIRIWADLHVGQPDILVSLDSLVLRSKTFLYKLSVKYFPFKARFHTCIFCTYHLQLPNLGLYVFHLLNHLNPEFFHPQDLLGKSLGHQNQNVAFCGRPDFGPSIEPTQARMGYG